MAAGTPLGVDGVRVGNWTDHDAATGCTVIVLPEGTVASGEIRGGAPATREFALLEPGRHVGRLDAVVLTGGSAFGLATADGVTDALAEQGVGFATTGGPVPIVVALSLYDLGTGSESARHVRPDAAAGRAALGAAATHCATGPIGAGAGATVGKWRGRDHARPGGLGVATITADGVTVSAVVAVNAVGDLPSESAEEIVARWPIEQPAFENTTIGVVCTNAQLAKDECRQVAEGGHDGMARALVPAHTRYDGDALVVAATGTVPGEVDRVRVLAAAAVERAIRSALS